MSRRSPMAAAARLQVRVSPVCVADRLAILPASVIHDFLVPIVPTDEVLHLTAAIFDYKPNLTKYEVQ